MQRHASKTDSVRSATSRRLWASRSMGGAQTATVCQRAPRFRRFGNVAVLYLPDASIAERQQAECRRRRKRLIGGLWVAGARKVPVSPLTCNFSLKDDVSIRIESPGYSGRPIWGAGNSVVMCRGATGSGSTVDFLRHLHPGYPPVLQVCLQRPPGLV